MARNYDFDRRISPANSFTLISTLSDTVDVRLIDLSALYTDDDMLQKSERDLRFPRGFHVNETGTLSILPAGNISGHAVSLYVVKGEEYRYSVRRFRSTGSSTFLANNIVAYR